MFKSATCKKRCLLWTAIIGGVLTIGTLVLAFVGIPLIIDKVIQDYLVIKEDTEAWDRFVELPFPLDLNIYFFHVENHKDVLSGEKPHLVERGPYIYKNYRKKYDIKREDSDHVSYYQKQLFEYDPERTASELSDTDEITTLNFLVAGLFQILEQSRAPIMEVLPVEEILPHVIEDPNLFTKLRVRDFLFGGTKFCHSKIANTHSKLVCMVVMLLNNKIITYNDDLSMEFSMFGFKNNTHDGRFVVNTGEKDILKLGQVQSWNDMKYTNIWGEGENHCNKVDGLDVTLFPPYFEENKDIKVYSTDVCRTLTLSYLDKAEFKDLEVFKYGLKGDVFRPESDECSNESCFCSNFTRGIDGKQTCFMDGVMDVYPCLGIPGLVSFPHFLYADTKYRDAVYNLHPNEDKHASTMKFQPFTGVPMEGWIAIQINLIARKIMLGGQLMKPTEHLSNFALPVIWLQQGVQINDEYYDLIHNAVTWITVADIGKWVLVGISGLMCLIPAARLMLL